jgi:hypothetical protein
LGNTLWERDAKYSWTRRRPMAIVGR